MPVNSDRRLTVDDIRDRAVLTVEEAGQLLGIGRCTAYQAAAEGHIPTIRISARRLVVPVGMLLAMLGEKH